MRVPGPRAPLGKSNNQTIVRTELLTRGTHLAGTSPSPLPPPRPSHDKQPVVIMIQRITTDKNARPGIAGIPASRDMEMKAVSIHHPPSAE